jgi:hypothetical protein
VLFRDTDGRYHHSVTIEKIEDLADFNWTEEFDLVGARAWKTFVYVAGPYTNGDPVLNTRNAIAVADRLHSMGYIPVIPHLSMLWHTVSPKPYDWWLEYDFELMSLCDAVVRLPGESTGADRECEHWTKEIGMYRPFIYLEEL